VTPLAYTRSGTGPPLVLLHGIGSSRRVWDPVRPALTEQFEVISPDLPGFGESAPLAPSVEPGPGRLAEAVGQLLDDLDLIAPHVVGNSLGGWVALELAAARPTSSVTLLSPAGLWRRRTPWYARSSLRASRWLSRHFEQQLGHLLNHRLGRVAVLGQTHGRPARMTPDQARDTIRAMGRAPGFDAAFEATLARRYRATAPIDAPVTVAFGGRDLILLPWQSRHLDQLPRDHHSAALPGCGHVPVFDDPSAVVQLIAASTRQGDARTVTQGW
jgi:pimeloyl-ACP methyl ester carboxylesterase